MTENLSNPISSSTASVHNPVDFSAVGATAGQGAADAGNRGRQKAVTGVAGAGRKDKGSTINPDYGKRVIKSYPITKAELGELYGIGITAALCFSVTTGLLGFAVNINKDLSFNPSLTEKIVERWEYISYGCLFVAAIFFIFGIIAVFFGRSKIAQIKSETSFGS